MDIHGARLSAALRSGGVSSTDIHAAAIETARSVKPDARRILDFGSGAGEFIPSLQSCYPNATVGGADIMGRPPNLPSHIEWYEGDLNDTLAISAGMFDLVCAIEVIEHLENPRHVLREIHRLLMPGGVAILTTPNTGSIRSLITLAMRGHHTLFDDRNYPAHITPMGEIDFTRAGKEAGFRAPHFFYTGVGSIPKLLELRWQQIPLIGRFLRGRRFSDNVGAVFVKPNDFEGTISTRSQARVEA